MSFDVRNEGMLEGIGRHQHGAMFRVGGDGEQPHQLVVVEDLGQGRRSLGARQVEVRVQHPRVIRYRKRMPWRAQLQLCQLNPRCS